MKSIANLADELGVTPAIIRSWQINLNLEHPRYAPDDAVYNADWTVFFGEVARLRKQGQSFSRIRSSLISQQPHPDTLPSLESLQRKTAVASPSSGGNGKASPFQAPEVSSERVLRPESDASDLGIYGPDEPSPLNFSFTSRDRRPALPVEDPGNALVRMGSENNLPSVQHLQRHMHEALVQQDLSKMAQTYVQLMENFQSLATRYGESHYVMGQLEEKAHALEKELQTKEQHFQAQEQLQRKRIAELEQHLESLKGTLNRREQDLAQHQDTLVTKDEISEVEKQLKLLAVTVFQQQEELARKSEAPSGFWQRFRQRWTRA